MSALRTLALALALALALPGCAKDEGVTGASVTLGAIEGVVVDPSQSPLEGALVVLDGVNHTARTDKTGAFRFSVLPGEYLVLATAPGHRGEAQRARPDAGAAVKLAFTLTPLPTESPTVQVAEAHGLLSCAAATKVAEDEASYSCGGQDPNERKELKFAVPADAGLMGIVVELHWSATTPTSKVLFLTLATGEGEAEAIIARGEGEETVTLVLPQRVLAETLPAGSDLVARVEPAGSMTDEEAAIDVGVDLQQPFTLYASYFYHAAPPGGYSATSG